MEEHDVDEITRNRIRELVIQAFEEKEMEFVEDDVDDAVEANLDEIREMEKEKPGATKPSKGGEGKEKGKPGEEGQSETREKGEGEQEENIGEMIKEGLEAGKSPEDIAGEIAEKYPDIDMQALEKRIKDMKTIMDNIDDINQSIKEGKEEGKSSDDIAGEIAEKYDVDEKLIKELIEGKPGKEAGEGKPGKEGEEGKEAGEGKPGKEGGESKPGKGKLGKGGKGEKGKLGKGEPGEEGEGSEAVEGKASQPKLKTEKESKSSKEMAAKAEAGAVDIDKMLKEALKKKKVSTPSETFGDFIDQDNTKLRDLLKKLAKEAKCTGEGCDVDKATLDKMKEIAKAFLTKNGKLENEKFLAELEGMNIEGLSDFAKGYSKKIKEEGSTDDLLSNLQKVISNKGMNANDKADEMGDILPALIERGMTDEQLTKLFNMLEKFAAEGGPGLKISPELEKLIQKAQIKYNSKISPETAQKNVEKRMAEIKKTLPERNPESQPILDDISELQALMLKSSKPIDQEILSILQKKKGNLDASIKGKISDDLRDEYDAIEKMQVSTLDLGFEKLSKLKKQLEIRQKILAKVGFETRVEEKKERKQVIGGFVAVPGTVEELQKRLKALGFTIVSVKRQGNTVDLNISIENEDGTTVTNIFLEYDVADKKLYKGDVQITDLTKLKPSLASTSKL